VTRLLRSAPLFSVESCFVSPADYDDDGDLKEQLSSFLQRELRSPARFTLSSD